MKKASLLAASIIVAAGCSNKNDPNERNFGAAINAYLEQKGSLCLNDERWPSERNEMDSRISSSMRGGDRMGALEKGGLISSATIEKPILSYDGKPTGRSQTITRYELTEKGKTSFRPAKSMFSTPKEGEVYGAFCYGNKSLDKVVKWEGPMKLGEYQAAKVTYHYKIENLADWAKTPEIQTSYPQIKTWIDGAGNKQQEHGVHLTSIGWEANGIDN